MIIRKIFASLLIIVFVAVSIPTLFLFSLKNTIFNPDFYKNEVTEQVQEFISEIGAQEVIKEQDFDKYMTKDEIKNEIKDVIDANVLENVVGSFFSALSNLEMIKRTGKIQISLLELKDKTPVIASKLANMLTDDIRTCSPGVTVIEENGLPSCIPSNFSRTDFVAELTNEIDKTLQSEIPAEYVFEVGDNKEQAEQLYSTLFILHYLPYFLAGLMVLVVLLIILIIYKPFSLSLRYASKGAIGGGITGLLLSRFVMMIPESIKQSSETINYKEATLNLLEFLTLEISDRILFYSIYLLGTGIIVFIIAIFASHKNREL